MLNQLLSRLRKISRQKGVILMYHQVCERKDDPWELAVHPHHFQAQLEYLKKNFRVVPVTEMAEGISCHRNKQAIAITFDDGFKNVYTNAAPLLDWLELPATFYVCSTTIMDEKVYWWDALQQMIFHTTVLPQQFEMTIDGADVHYSLSTDHILTDRIVHQIRAWNYNLPVPNERVELYMRLWHLIRPLPYAQQDAILEFIREWAGGGDYRVQDGLTMNVREMQMLSQHPLFTIGAHSVHHAMLSRHNLIEQAYEVKESKRQLEKWLGKPVNGFAYPYGNYNDITRQLLMEAGYQYAVSTESKSVNGEEDLFALPRMQVKNWSVYEFASKINELIDE